MTLIALVVGILLLAVGSVKTFKLIASPKTKSFGGRTSYDFHNVPIGTVIFRGVEAFLYIVVGMAILILAALP